MNHRDHEVILGLMGEFHPTPTPTPTTEDEPLLLDELTKELRELRHTLEEQNKIQRVQNEALKVLADQGVQAMQQVVGIMQVMWAEHNAPRRH